MARFDSLSGIAGDSTRTPTSYYKSVTEFRGMDLDTLAKQYALYRQLNSLDTKTPTPSGAVNTIDTLEHASSPGLINRLFGRFAGF